MGWGPPKIVEAVSTGLTTGATPYSAGDQYGDVMTLPSVVAANNGYGVITAITLIDDGDVIVGTELWVFTDAVTEAADNAAFSFSDADLLKLVPGFPLSLPVATDASTGRAASVPNLWLPFRSGTTHDDLMGYLVCRGAHNQFAAADDLHLLVSVIQYT